MAFTYWIKATCDIIETDWPSLATRLVFNNYLENQILLSSVIQQIFDFDYLQIKPNTRWCWNSCLNFNQSFVIGWSIFVSRLGLQDEAIKCAYFYRLKFFLFPNKIMLFFQVKLGIKFEDYWNNFFLLQVWKNVETYIT